MIIFYCLKIFALFFLPRYSQMNAQSVCVKNFSSSRITHIMLNKKRIAIRLKKSKNLYKNILGFLLMHQQPILEKRASKLICIIIHLWRVIKDQQFFVQKLKRKILQSNSIRTDEPITPVEIALKNLNDSRKEIKISARQFEQDVAASNKLMNQYEQILTRIASELSQNKYNRLKTRKIIDSPRKNFSTYEKCLLCIKSAPFFQHYFKCCF